MDSGFFFAQCKQMNANIKVIYYEANIIIEILVDELSWNDKWSMWLEALEKAVNVLSRL